MVRSAHEIGIKPTARLYKCTRHVVKKWCRRYALYGLKGLKDLSRRPKHSPKRIPDEDIIKIKECVDDAKNKKKYITVNNVRRKTKIKEYSDTTINRYINISCNGKKQKTCSGIIRCILEEQNRAFYVLANRYQISYRY